MHPGMESGYQPNYGVQNAIPSAITVPSQSGAPSDPDQTIYRTPQGTPAVASGPKLTPEARQTYTGGKHLLVEEEVGEIEWIS